MEKIPEYILEAIDCGETVASDFYSKYGKNEIDLALSDLKKSDQEILSCIDTSKLYDAVTKRIERNKHKHFSVQRFVPFAVAAALVVMVLPGVVKSQEKSTPDTVQNDVRIKGSKVYAPQLFLYQKEGEEVKSLSSGSRVGEGDLVQIGYNSNGGKYGVIFSIDGNHQVTNHFGIDNLLADKVENKTSYLDYSYQLDDAPGYEVFIMVTSNTMFDASDAIKVLKEKRLVQLINSKYVKHRFDGNCEVTVFYLLK